MNTTTMPATECKTWCEDRDGHTNAISREDQLCMSPEHTVSLSREDDSQLMAYLEHDPVNGQRVTLARDEARGVELTTAEAEQLRDALTALLEV